MKVNLLFVLPLLGLLLVLGLVSGCAMDAQSVDRPSGSVASVDVLFTDRDGYTVKRFSDGMVFHYYVTPGPARVMDRKPNGKNSTRPEEIVTAP